MSGARLSVDLRNRRGQGITKAKSPPLPPDESMVNTVPLIVNVPE